MSNSTSLAAKAGKPAAAKAAKGSLREDLKRFTSEKLLQAAMQCFAEQGFRATTVERIVEVAGTTAPTFYRHYPSKNDLLPPLRTHLSGIVANTLAKLDGERCRSRAGVRAWLDDYLAMWNQVHRLCDAYWEAAALDDDFAAEALPETMQAMGVLKLYFASLPEAEQARVGLRLALMLLFIDRLALLASVAKSKQAAEQMVDEFADMLWTTVFEPNARG